MNTIFKNYSAWCCKLPAIAFAAAICAGSALHAQTTEEDVYELSPFEVSASGNVGYLATSTLAGTRLNTDLDDVGSAISVITKEFLEDTGATDNESLLVYTTATETSGVNGTFSGIGNEIQAEGRNFLRPDTNNRVRGLDAADNTRNFFLTDIPWDSYNTDRIDIQRGPNAILFGIGSPAGIINANVTGADFLKDATKVELRVGSYGSTRASFNTNQVIIDNELAVRIAALYDDEKFKQDPAYEEDKRLYFAARYSPDFMKTDSSRMTIKFSYENGEIESNRPRTRPPEDRITDWFNGAQKVTSDLVTAYNDIEGNPESNGVFRTDGKWAFIEQRFAGHKVYFDQPYSGTPSYFEAAEIQYVDNFAIGPDGTFDGGGIDAFPFQRQIGIVGFQRYAQLVGLPYASTLNPYVNKSLTDPSIFDYENILLDGPNKMEWRDFETYNITVEETLFDGMFGIEAVLDHQEYEDGRSAMLGNVQPLTVEINELYSDGSPNPNVGRPVLYQRQRFNSAGTQVDRDSWRVTAYADIDFNDIRQNDNWLTKLLGRHVFTGMASGQEIESKNRSWYRVDPGPQIYSAMGYKSILENESEMETVSYIGPSMLGLSSPSGLNLSGVTAFQDPRGIPFRTFDSHWNSTVDPAAPWINPFYGSVSTQSENAENYVGWINMSNDLFFNPDGTNPILFDKGQKNLQNIDSSALIWQAYLLDEMFVVTYGHRKDEAESTTIISPQDPITESALLDDPSYVYPEDVDNMVEGTSDSWSVVMHIPDFIVSKTGFLDKLSFFYNESENFQPAANRADHFGRPLDAPSGSTTDYGFNISALDNKISLRVNWYESSLSNASFDPGNLWFLGSVETRAWVAAKGFEAGLAGDPAFQNSAGLYTQKGGQTKEEALALQAQHVEAVLSNVAPNEFWAAWGSEKSETRWRGRRWDPQAEGGYVPPGLTSTADKTSEGTEIELFLKPTNNWNIILNASRVEAINSNMAGSLKEWVEARNAVWNGLAGDIRMWSGGGNNSIKNMWNQSFYSRYLLSIQKEGTAVGELREWQWSIVTNYRFSDGLLKGLSVGGSLRWEDDVVIGYPVYTDEDGVQKFDIDNPWKGPTEDHLDLWIAYNTKLTDKINWKIQLNIRDALSDGGLIPVAVQADGSGGQYRIGPSRRFMLTSTFTF